MSTITGQLKLNALTPDLVDNGQTISSTANTPILGDGTIRTNVVHDTGEFVGKTQQFQLRANTNVSETALQSMVAE